jgi:hypothetical protein
MPRNQHRVGPRQLEEMERQLRLLWTAVHGPSLAIPPGDVIARLSQLTSDLGVETTAQPRGFLGSNPDDFLYLTLPDEVLDISVTTFDFGPDAALASRIRHAFKLGHIRTIGDLLSWSRTELLQMRTVGPTLIDIIEQALADRGWHLSRHDVQVIEPPLGDTWWELASGRVVLASRIGREPLTELKAATLKGAAAEVKLYKKLIDAYRSMGITTIGQLLELSKFQVVRLKWADHLGQPDDEFQLSSRRPKDDFRLPNHPTWTLAKTARVLTERLLALNHLQLRQV